MSVGPIRLQQRSKATWATTTETSRTEPIGAERNRAKPKKPEDLSHSKGQHQIVSNSIRETNGRVHASVMWSFVASKPEHWTSCSVEQRLELSLKIETDIPTNVNFQKNGLISWSRCFTAVESIAAGAAWEAFRNSGSLQCGVGHHHHHHHRKHFNVA